ncbi:MAG TPA: hypothetical protein ACQGQX_05965, partial [Xylella taiwanensis]
GGGRLGACCLHVLVLSGSRCVDAVFEVVLTAVLVKRGVMAEHGAPCGGCCCCFSHRGTREVLVSGPS